MNKDRRYEISKIINRVDRIEKDLQLIYDKEKNVCNNIPDNLKNSRMGDEAIVASINIKNAIEALKKASKELGEIIE